MRLFRQYGIPVQIQREDVLGTVSGFVHYSATTARKYALPGQSPLGKVPQGHCRLLLPAYSVKEGDLVACDDRWHIVRLVERVWLGNKALYDRCLCEERGGNDRWGR